MKIYCLEFISTRNDAAERIWHTNRRALERYAKALESPDFQLRSIKAFDVPVPLTESRMVAFLNAHCADFMPSGLRERPYPPHERPGRGVGSG
jgi:hypothetical protein